MAKKQTDGPDYPGHDDEQETLENQTTVDPVVPLEPSGVTEREPNVEPHIPRGHVWLVSIDAAGNEVPNSGFTIAERGYLDHFSDTTKFKLKKKAD